MSSGFHSLGMFLVYGQFSVSRGLDTYYSRQGFGVLPTASGVNLQHQFGMPLALTSEHGEQLFVWWRGNPPRYVWKLPDFRA